VAKNIVTSKADVIDVNRTINK